MNQLFERISLPAFLQPLWMQTLIGISVLVLLVLVLHVVARKFLLSAVRELVEKSPGDWDDVLFEARVPHRASGIISLLALRIGVNWIPGLPPFVVEMLNRAVGAGLVLVIALTVDSLLSAAHTFYLRTPSAALRPIKSYVQLTKIFVYSIAFIFIVATLAEQSPWYLVSGLGAAMAIILLIFRDTLLSLVASVRLSNNDLIRVGDWIEMPQFNADGDVVDIALTAVKVKNWDKTITVVPTHKFLDNSFKNWRAMSEGGGRRIKRAININTTSIRFLTDEEIERFGRFPLLSHYIAEKVKELDEHDALYAADPTAILTSRRLTNIGTLRAYISAYLRSLPSINKELTFLIRQLEPTPEGLPIQIYVFTADTRWAYHEGIQADVFDHILSMMDQFGLEVYQRPSGRDVAGLAGVGSP